MRYALDFVILTIIYIYLLSRWKEKGAKRIVINTLMYGYISTVIYFTLMPVAPNILNAFFKLISGNAYNDINLTPFIDYMLGRGDFIRQIVLNIAMTIPFGFILNLYKRRSLFVVLLLSLLLSSCIEFIQPLFDRNFDITDMITNSLGGVIGHLIFVFLRSMRAKFFSR